MTAATPLEITRPPNLLPCPFCGGTPHLISDGVVWSVACGACDGPHRKKGEAEAAWNARVPPVRQKPSRGVPVLFAILSDLHYLDTLIRLDPAKGGGLGRGLLL